MSGAVTEKSPFFRPTTRKSSIHRGNRIGGRNRIGGSNSNRNGYVPKKNRRSSKEILSSLSHSSRSATATTSSSSTSSPNSSSSSSSPTSTNIKSKELQEQEQDEHKSTIVGCSSNLVNAIVGAGIVGIPYAIQESGLIPGIFLVLFSALVTEKSLRLLIETAKHSNTPSYETLAEACYGKFGFLFISLNMFIMAYGALLSYLMIIKDTFSTILGISKDDYESQRYILLIISFCVVLPISCQRDMADLAKTSKMNVVLDTIIVCIVVYLAQLTPTKILRTIGYYQNNEDNNHYYENNDYENIENTSTNTNTTNDNDINIFEIPYRTIFIGLGVLSFAFVCQHSSFIIAGSLQQPTKERWSKVTRLGVGSASSLALLMGICGYLGFANTINGDGEREGDAISGNILNSLPTDSIFANIARGLLGITMLFVYPLESFVARHVCVVLFFHGRQAHEGDDSSVLNRRDRRITVTILIYLLAVIPAALCTDLGNVLAITGSIGGSSLSYIGPGIIYIGIHGGRFLELSEQYFGTTATSNSNNSSASTHIILLLWKKFLWCLWGMPLWIKLATIGKHQLTEHVTDMALKSPHPIRIGNVRYARAKYTTMHGSNDNGNGNGNGSNDTKIFTRVVMLQQPKSKQQNNNNNNHDNSYNRSDDDVQTKLLRADSLPKFLNNSSKVNNMMDGTIAALPPSAFRGGGVCVVPPYKNNKGIGTGQQPQNSYESINTKIGANQMKRDEEKDKNDDSDSDDSDLEDDPQRDPPSIVDFIIAISYIIFGVIALAAGLMSIFLGGGDGAEIV